MAPLLHRAVIISHSATASTLAVSTRFTSGHNSWHRLFTCYFCFPAKVVAFTFKSHNTTYHFFSR